MSKKFVRQTDNDVALRAHIGVLEEQLGAISKTGIALRCRSAMAAGTEIEVDLPFAAGLATGRIIRCDGSTVAVEFDQDLAALARVASVVTNLSAARGAA